MASASQKIFGDMDHAVTEFDENMMGKDDYIGWYDRRNRFMDLYLHVRDMHGRVVRTPE